MGHGILAAQQVGVSCDWLGCQQSSAAPTSGAVHNECACDVQQCPHAHQEHARLATPVGGGLQEKQMVRGEAVTQSMTWVASTSTAQASVPQPCSGAAGYRVALLGLDFLTEACPRWLAAVTELCSA